MKKLMILAVSALLVANVSAQEQKKECCKSKQLNKEERVSFEVKRFVNELLLSDEQAAKFAVTYREYADALDQLFQKNAPKKDFEPGKELTDKELDQLAKQRFDTFKGLADLQSKYYDKFRSFLSARQVEKVLQFQAPCGPRFFGPQACCGNRDDHHACKQDGRHKGKKGHKREGKHGHHPEAFRPDGPRPDGPRPEAPQATE